MRIGHKKVEGYYCCNLGIDLLGKAWRVLRASRALLFWRKHPAAPPPPSIWVDTSGGVRLMNENRIIAAIPDDEQRRLRPHLEHMTLNLGDVLHEPGDSLPYIYFPIKGVVSLLTTVEERESIEVGTVGPEGMVGVPVFLGVNRMLTRAIAQIPGEALRMGVEAFKEAAHRNVTFHQLLHQYSYAQLSQMAQTIACNRYHNNEKRLARWLLRIRDHLQSNSFYLPQEFIAAMLGIKRPHITVAAGKLQRAGLISYHRGAITICDRRGLKRVACECYGAIKQGYDGCLKT